MLYKKNTKIKREYGEFLNEVKNFLKISEDDENQLLNTLISIAIEKFEDYTGKILLIQELEIEFFDLDVYKLELPIWPIVKINTLKKQTISGLIIELPEKSYKIIDNTIIFNYNNEFLSLKVDLIAGITNDLTGLPGQIKMAILDIIAFSFENRSNSGSYPITRLDHFKKWRI